MYRHSGSMLKRYIYIEFSELKLATAQWKEIKYSELKLATAQCKEIAEAEAARYEQTLPPPSLRMIHLKLFGTKRI